MSKFEYPIQQKRVPKAQRKDVPFTDDYAALPVNRLRTKNHDFTQIMFIGILTVFLGSLAACSTSKSTADTSTSSLNHYTFSQLDSLMNLEQRPLAVFLNADWCRFCKNMEQTTFKNPDVIDLLNENFYFVSFDGEQKERVYFNQQIFDYQPTGRNTGTHQLAKALGTIDGVLAYPSFVILQEAYEIVFQYNAYLDARRLQAVLEKVL